MSRETRTARTAALGLSAVVIAAAAGFGSPPMPAPSPDPVTQSELAQVSARLSAIDVKVGRLEDRQFWLWLLCGGTAATGSAAGVAFSTWQRRTTAHSAHPSWSSHR